MATQLSHEKTFLQRSLVIKITRQKNKPYKTHCINNHKLEYNVTLVALFCMMCQAEVNRQVICIDHSLNARCLFGCSMPTALWQVFQKLWHNLFNSHACSPYGTLKAKTLQLKVIFLNLVLGIWSRVFSLLTASLMCLGWSGGVSPHFSQTSNAVRTKDKLFNYIIVQFKLQRNTNKRHLLTSFSQFAMYFLKSITHLLQQFLQQKPWKYQTWQSPHSGTLMILLWTGSARK